MGEGMLLCEMPVGSWVLLVDHFGGDLSALQPIMMQVNQRTDQISTTDRNADGNELLGS